MSCYGMNKENKCYAEVYTMEESKMMAYKPNLLLNGDFKVNQGGQLVYENPAYTAQDSIDKWKIMAGKVNTSFVNYLTIESYNETGSSYFLQNFDSDKSGNFVISLKVLNINKGSFRVYFEGTNQQDSYTISSKGIYKITFRDVKNATGVCLALDNFSGDIEYIRLDEGTVPLPHMKEDYEIALARCGAISELNNKIVNVEQSFTAGCNTIVGGCTANGVTPKSNSPADIVNAITAIKNSGLDLMGAVVVLQAVTSNTFEQATSTYVTTDKYSTKYLVFAAGGSEDNNAFAEITVSSGSVLKTLINKSDNSKGAMCCKLVDVPVGSTITIRCGWNGDPRFILAFPK